MTKPTGKYGFTLLAAHLDLKRLKKNSIYRMDTADPIGVETFRKQIKTVRRTGATTYAGTFDANGGGTDGFLPLGAPSMVVFTLGAGGCTFTATTDAAGRVTAIDATVKVNDGTVKMSTKLSAHGQATGIKKPARTSEVAGFVYE